MKNTIISLNLDSCLLKKIDMIAEKNLMSRTSTIQLLLQDTLNKKEVEMERRKISGRATLWINSMNVEKPCFKNTSMVNGIIRDVNDEFVEVRTGFEQRRYPWSKIYFIGQSQGVDSDDEPCEMLQCESMLSKDDPLNIFV